VTGRAAVFFSMGEAGHFQRLRSLIAGLAAAGLPVRVFTHRDFRAAVERAGGTFVDLFDGAPLAAADDESLPVPCRFVTFAGRHAGRIAERVAAERPALIVHDTFAVVGRVVATLLGVPRVNVCAGHAVVPRRFLAELERDPRVRVAARCREAVRALRERYGIADASPFSYVDSLSSDLNVYCEPPEFLDAADRAAFEPLAFFGSLPDAEELGGGSDGGPGYFPAAAAGDLRVYVSFGTVVWRYYAAAALAALAALADAFAATPRLRAVISLAGVEAGDAATALARPNVTVLPIVDQWRILGESDLFVTHHGMNSTHEAIYRRVPMLSCPFFWDQPALAARCRRLGIAQPVGAGPRAGLDAISVRAALARFADEREAMRAALEAVRRWELETIAGRPAVVRRIIELAGRPHQPASSAGGGSFRSASPADPHARP
jgi:MGT family glycosyltransferase